MAGFHYVMNLNGFTHMNNIGELPLFLLMKFYIHDV